ncbi:class I SAM-dependent methyltransferase [Asanoa sp. NPDC050611]|uniref:class I SAM-dependent methyltransferase n=1 Tax=Asanoa sp. NPDC050611 TaxID=3157098 RepID=UPI0033F95992
MDAQFWEDMYRGSDQVFSGNPNGILVTEAADLPPGRALDVGCGEGGDALWLARRGWTVTATDVSQTALRRGAAAGADVADRVTWTRADLTTAPPAPGAYDLVTVQYFPLRKDAGLTAVRGLLAAVAPGGILLYGSHDPADLAGHHDHDVDPHDYYLPGDVAALLDGGWEIQANETRARTTPPPPGTPHVNDVVLRARRYR